MRRVVIQHPSNIRRRFGPSGAVRAVDRDSPTSHFRPHRSTGVRRSTIPKLRTRVRFSSPALLSSPLLSPLPAPDPGAPPHASLGRDDDPTDDLVDIDD
jgi:hypothetical protein